MTSRYWNAGDAGCGSLIAGLKREIERIAAGELLSVSTNNAGAPADLPAWCRLTGHTLVAADHPVYVIRRKDE